MRRTRVSVHNETKGTVLFSRGEVARKWRDRLIGLIGRRALEEEYGLVIEPCESVHTFWMRIPIDVVFIDVECNVVRAFPGVRPWRARFGGWNADTVIEGPAGMIARSRTEAGDRLRIIET